MPVLREISFEIGAGEFVAVIGHNGSGKSTLAKLLNMLLVPDSGEIYISGKNITYENLSDDDIIALRHEIGMVFQNPDDQIIATIVEDDVAFGPENLGVPPAEIRKRVDDALRDVGMSDYASHEPHRLSGGQKQRVAIAGIIAMLPSCIIFDESTAMLDPVGRKEVLATIEKLNREKGITVIMITHYMEEAVLADRVIVLADGRIALDGTPAAVFAEEEKLIQIGLSVPQSEYIARRLRERGIDLADGCLTPEKCAEAIVAALERTKGEEGKKA